MKTSEKKIGEIGIYLYALSSFISKTGINIGIALMLIASILLIFKNKKNIFNLEPEEKYFIFILILLPITNLFSLGGNYSCLRILGKSHRYLGLLLIPLFLKNRDVLKKSFSFLLLSLLINFINGIYVYSKLDWNFEYRYLSFASNTLDDAHMMAMMGVLMLSVFIYTLKFKTTKYKLMNLLFFIISFIILVLSKGRGAWLAFLGSSFIILFLLVKNKKKYLFGIFVSVIFACFLIKTTPVLNNNSYFKRFESITETKSNASNGIRLFMWEASFDTFKNNFPFGVGRNKFSKYALNYLEKNKIYEKVSYKDSLKNIASSGNQHSMYFKSLSEDGIFFFPFIGMFIFFLYQQFLFLKKIKRNKLEFYFVLGNIGILIAFCIGGLTEISWNEIWFSNFFCFNMGIYLGIKKYLKGDIEE